jgi:phosphatidylglycerol:prolipoprotein diacylglycerol transferase
MGAWLEQLHGGATSARWLPAWSGMQLAAVLAALAWFAWRTPGPLARLRVCLLVGFIGAALGAVGLALLVRIPEWARSGFSMRVLARGGVMAYGALAGLAVVYSIMARLRGFCVRAALDRLAPCFGLMILLARSGCFFGGCDFGVVTSAPWAVRFPPGTPAFRQHLDAGLILAADRGSLAVHPTQIYEALAGIAVAATALFVERRRAPAGSAFTAAAATYAACRFIIEFFRGDLSRGRLGTLSTSQWLSLLVLAGAAVFAARSAASRRGDERSRDAPKP